MPRHKIHIRIDFVDLCLHGTRTPLHALSVSLLWEWPTQVIPGGLNQGKDTQWLNEGQPQITPFPQPYKRKVTIHYHPSKVKGVFVEFSWLVYTCSCAATTRQISSAYSCLQRRFRFGEGGRSSSLFSFLCRKGNDCAHCPRKDWTYTCIVSRSTIILRDYQLFFSQIMQFVGMSFTLSLCHNDRTLPSWRVEVREL